MTRIPEKLTQLPIWTGPVKAVPLEGGLSNESWVAENDGEKFVVRFCEDVPVHHVERGHEIMASKAAFKAGLAPELVFHDKGVMVFRFIEARTYGVDDIRPNLGRLIDLIKAFHHDMPAHMSGPARLFDVFHYVRDYARTLEQGGSRFVDQLDRFKALARGMAAVQVPMHLVVTHNDLLPANFLDDGERIWLIDFEYTAFGTPAFDLANLSANAGFDAGEDARLLELYFGVPASEALKKSHSAMKCASALREAMWSMVSELHLDAPGANYDQYSNECLESFETALEQHQSKFGKLSG